MKSKSNLLPKSRSIEFDSIRVDAHFYQNLLIQLNSHKSSRVLIFSLIPYLSLFVVETYNFLKNTLPLYSTNLSMSHKKMIIASRMKTKFFDDSTKRIDGMFELLSWITQFHNKLYIGQHKGILAPLKRVFQADLGIFFYENHIVGSTHTGLINLGLEKEDLPAFLEAMDSTIHSLSRSIGVEMGSYIAQLSQWPEFTCDKANTRWFDYKLIDNNLGYKDEKSAKYFSSVFNGSGAEVINLSLLLFLTATNFLNYIFKHLVVGSPVTLFKLKFITLHHLSSSLGKLRNYYFPKGLLTERSKNYFQKILDDKDLELIRRQSSLRNILVHYKIDKVTDNNLSETANLYGLVEYFMNGATYDDIDKILDSQIARVSLLLEE